MSFDGDPVRPTRYYQPGLGGEIGPDGKSQVVQTVGSPEMYDGLDADDLSELEGFMEAEARRAYLVRLACLKNICGFDDRPLSAVADELGTTRANMSKVRLQILHAMKMESYLRTAADRQKIRERTTLRHAQKKAAHVGACAANESNSLSYEQRTA